MPTIEAVAGKRCKWSKQVLDISSTLGIMGGMSSDLQSLGSMLKDARNRLGLSLREAESKSGVSNAYLSQLEGGKIKQPSPQILHKLCDLLGCSYTMAMELAGYPIPTASRRSPANTRFLARLGKTTREEEESMLEYLQFLRSRRR